jgi:hypothetical protein
VVADLDDVADDGDASDGPAGARDNVMTDVENLVGGGGNDTLSGSPVKNELTGGLGADSMRGLEDDDTLFANDGVADAEVNCDGGATPGTADVAHVDALDPLPTNCETSGP